MTVWPITVLGNAYAVANKNLRMRPIPIPRTLPPPDELVGWRVSGVWQHCVIPLTARARPAVVPAVYAGFPVVIFNADEYPRRTVRLGDPDPGD